MAAPPRKPSKPPLSYFIAKEEASGLASCLDAQKGLITAKKYTDRRSIDISRDRIKRLRGAVINEIITTEEVYVSDLQFVIESFLIPIRKSGVLTMQDIGQLFSNIELVWDANRSILEELLYIRNDNPATIRIGEVLQSTAEYFIQVYTHYCLNQATVTRAYASLMKRSKCRTLIEKLEANPNCKRLDLLSFLVKPVQRLCKYPLLLRELLKYTSPNHPDHRHLEAAITSFSSLVALVNQSSREAANIQKMVEIEASLLNAKHMKLMIPGRRFIRSGRLTKISAGNVQERMFFLFNDLLLYAKPHLVKTKMFEFRGVIPLSLCFVKDLPDTDSLKNSIEIWRIDLKKKYIVYADSAESKAEWFSDLNTLVSEAHDVEVAGTTDSQEATEELTGSGGSVAFQIERSDGGNPSQSLKMAELESRIVGFKNLTKPGRQFIKEGAVSVNLKNNNPGEVKPRHFFMFNDILVIAKRHGGSAKKSFHVKEQVPLSMVLVQDLEDTQASVLSSDMINTFEIVRLDNKTKIFVKCATDVQKKEWVESLSEAMESGALRLESQRPASYAEHAIGSQDAVSRLSSRDSKDSISRISSKDSLSRSCAACSAAFGISRQRKRCGMCDAVFCSACCSKKRSKGTRTVRCCEKCFLTK